MKKRKFTRTVRCPYCGANAVLRDAEYVYGPNALVEKLYVCSNYPACDSYVGVFPDTNTPKGSLANSELRNKRIRAHKCFDAIWKQGIMTRGQTYQWMQHKFALTKKQAHIGFFSDHMCEVLINACYEVLENNIAKEA